jgi:hypothetical protein
MKASQHWICRSNAGPDGVWSFLPVGHRAGLGVGLGSGQEEPVRGRGVTRYQGRGGLGVQVAGGLAPGGIPAVSVAVGNAGDGREDLPDVHHALGGVADSAAGQEVEAFVGEKASDADGIRGLRQGGRVGHRRVRYLLVSGELIPARLAGRPPGTTVRID